MQRRRTKLAKQNWRQLLEGIEYMFKQCLSRFFTEAKGRTVKIGWGKSISGPKWSNHSIIWPGLKWLVEIISLDLSTVSLRVAIIRGKQVDLKHELKRQGKIYSPDQGLFYISAENYSLNGFNPFWHIWWPTQRLSAVVQYSVMRG